MPHSILSVEIPNRVESHPVHAQQVDDSYAKSWLAKKGRHKGERLLDFQTSFSVSTHHPRVLKESPWHPTQLGHIEWKQING